MFVNTQQVQLGLTNFVENEIAKKAVGLNKFMVYFAMPIISKKVMQYVDAYSKDPLTKDMFDDNRNIDIDTIYNMAKTAVQRSGQFTMYGIVFNETDIDKLYSYIKGELQ
jgi:allophanate hydrolase subunit 1